MRLREWIRAEGAGAIARLHEATGLSRQTISKLVNDPHVPHGTTAKLISEATGGVVSVEELIDLPRRRARAA